MSDLTGIVLMIAFILFCLAPEQIGKNAAQVVLAYEAVMEDGR